MISTKTREKWNTKIVILITALISLLLVFGALLLDKEYQDARNILISIACSIWASNLIMYSTSAYMLRSSRRREIIDSWGLEAIYKTRAEMNISSNLVLDNCKKHLDIIAFGLKNFREAKNNVIDKLLDNGVDIRILTLCPESALVPYVDKRENLVAGATKKSIQDLNNWVTDKNKIRKKGHIILKTYDFLPLDFYFRVDDHVYVGPYLKDISSQQTISMEYTHGEGVNYWKGYFETVWNSLS
jgi:hypothetical protein